MSVSESPRLFIGGLKRNVEKEELTEEFKEYGEIVDVWIAYDPPGFAFVEYSTNESATAALEAKHKTVCFGCEIRVELTKKKAGSKQEEDNSKPRLFIGNIVQSVEKEDLRAVFEKYGSVTDVWIAHNPPGFAFVEFDDNENADKAVTECNGQEHFGGTIKVQITKGRKEGRRNRVNDRRERGRGHSGPPHTLPRRSPYAPPHDPYRRRLPPPARYARDPYARDPYARDPYARDPYARDPYYDDPYARDPYARRPIAAEYAALPPRRRPPPAARTDPYAVDPYAVDPYATDPYAADPYATDYTADYVDPRRPAKPAVASVAEAAPTAAADYYTAKDPYYPY